MSLLKKLTALSLLILIMLSSASCYRMPGENDYSVVPCINNPDITHEKSSGNFAPNVGY